MKHYPKTYQDLYDDKGNFHWRERIGSLYGSLDTLTETYRAFFMDATRTIFRLAVEYKWLSLQFTYNGTPRHLEGGSGAYAGGFASNKAFRTFLIETVGHDQAIFSMQPTFIIINQYIQELFPEFEKHNPFEEPEYYKYPFEHISLGFLAYVYQVDNRLELLKYADEEKMDFRTFLNWANNWIMCYNEEHGQTYGLTTRQGRPVIKDERKTRHNKKKGYEKPTT